jgi:two-component system, NtrC family, response regulator AtoC
MSSSPNRDSEGKMPLSVSFANPGSESAEIKQHNGFVTGLGTAMRALESVISEVAPTNIPILLVGESGTGKATFANHIHCLSRYRNKPFLRISCAAMSASGFPGLLGLNSSGTGGSTWNAAGTTFFDEISELDLACQRNLLCALPDGDAGPHQALLTTRIVSATSRNLDEEVRAGRFRSQLYYRINGVNLRLPPLRERKEDIPELVEWFLTKQAEQLGRPRPALSRQTLQLFMDHSWPGNIRELENVVKRIVAIGDEALAIGEWETVPYDRRFQESPARDCSLKAAARAASREAERELILKALARTHWNRKRAAQELQISYKSLLYKLKQIAVEDSGTN